MKVFNYDTQGFLSGTEIAARSPLDNMFLVPAMATCKEPPTCPKGKLAQWVSTGPECDDGDWAVVDDPRALAEREARTATERAEFEKRIFAVEYEAESGKILGYGPYLSLKGKNIIELEVSPEVLIEHNKNGVCEQRVVEGKIVDRTSDEIAQDKGNMPAIVERAEAAIKGVLYSVNGEQVEYATHLMNFAQAQDTKISPDLYSTEQKETAEKMLNRYRAAFAAIQRIKEGRDAELAVLVS